jgi:7-cyano-7-deazaguanine synthase
MKKAVILLSGGLDSATITAIAKQQQYQLYALSFDYGQRHKIELEAARKIAKSFGVIEHKIANVDLRVFGGSALTADIEVPKNQSNNNSIPITYVPARNTIFLSYALGYAEVIGASDIFIGVNAVDYSGYPDCRIEFIKAFETMANLATAVGVGGGKIHIQTPLINLSKKEIIKIGLDLKVDYSIAHSCYDPVIKDNEVYACGSCDSCLFRLKGFSENKVPDPYKYCSNH